MLYLNLMGTRGVKWYNTFMMLHAEVTILTRSRIFNFTFIISENVLVKTKATTMLLSRWSNG